MTLLLGLLLGCGAQDEPVAEPSVPPDAAGRPPVAELHFSLDQSVTELAHDGEPAQRVVSEGDLGEFERDCPGGRPEDHRVETVVRHFDGGSVEVYDHLVTLHTAAQVCQRGERDNRNRHHDDCVLGGCVYLDCFMDPLKFKCDPEGRTPSLALGEALSLSAWVRPDPGRQPWGRTQVILRADDLSFGYILTAADRLELELGLAGQAVRSPAVEIEGAADGRFLHLASTVSQGDGVVRVRLFLDGTPIHEAALPGVSWGPSTHLQGLGDGLCGSLDELRVVARELSPEAIARAAGAHSPLP